MQLNLFTDNVGQDVSGVIVSPPVKVITEYPTVDTVGAWGVKWRGKDIPRPKSMYENDFISVFGFTCAGCGVSVINQETLIHKAGCDSKNPHKGREEGQADDAS